MLKEESNTILIIIIKPNSKNNQIIYVGGVSRIVTMKYGLESPRDSDPSRTALARTSNNSQLQTRPL
jgi:hypothetical protein